jgi:hypothetical protein
MLHFFEITLRKFTHSGMKWHKKSASIILSLRTLERSNHWEQFWGKSISMALHVEPLLHIVAKPNRLIPRTWVCLGQLPIVGIGSPAAEHQIQNSDKDTSLYVLGEYDA